MLGAAFRKQTVCGQCAPSLQTLGSVTMDTNPDCKVFCMAWLYMLARDYLGGLPVVEGSRALSKYFFLSKSDSKGTILTSVRACAMRSSTKRGKSM